MIPLILDKCGVSWNGNEMSGQQITPAWSNLEIVHMEWWHDTAFIYQYQTRAIAMHSCQSGETYHRNNHNDHDTMLHQLCFSAIVRMSVHQQSQLVSVHRQFNMRIKGHTKNMNPMHTTSSPPYLDRVTSLPCPPRMQLYTTLHTQISRPQALYRSPQHARPWEHTFPANADPHPLFCWPTSFPLSLLALATRLSCERLARTGPDAHYCLCEVKSCLPEPGLGLALVLLPSAKGIPPLT